MFSLGLPSRLVNYEVLLSWVFYFQANCAHLNSSTACTYQLFWRESGRNQRGDFYVAHNGYLNTCDCITHADVQKLQIHAIRES
jgi:hypothetical protein